MLLRDKRERDSDMIVLSASSADSTVVRQAKHSAALLRQSGTEDQSGAARVQQQIGMEA